MKNSIFTIMKKELARFFGDKRMVVSILLPGILIYVMYSFMGDAMGSMYGVEEDYVYKIQAQNLPASIEYVLDGFAASDDSLPLEVTAVEDLSAAKQAVTDQELDLVMVFQEDFDEAVAKYTGVTDSQTRTPNIALYYNSASMESQAAYRMMVSLLDGYESVLANKFDINGREDEYDLATDEDAAGSYFASLLPLLLMIFLYSGCSAVAPESIAGEKERGTIATMLITPIRRSDIAVGKILALAIIALLSGASSTLGTILALPKLMGAASDDISAAIYGAGDYLLLAAVILSTVLLLVTVISILSAFAKTIKEAQTYAMPMMILVMVLGITAMFGGGAKQELAAYLIPLYNSVQCMIGVFSFTTLTTGVAATLAVNGACTIAGVVVLAGMFNSEKVIFSK